MFKGRVGMDVIQNSGLVRYEARCKSCSKIRVPKDWIANDLQLKMNTEIFDLKING